MRRTPLFVVLVVLLATITSIAVADDDYDEDASNVVKVINYSEAQRFLIKGRAQLNVIDDETVQPYNEGYAKATGNGLATRAAALQLNPYENGASVVAPVNTAVAINNDCDGCVTWVDAIQYSIKVDDAEELEEELENTFDRWNRELKQASRLAKDGQIVEAWDMVDSVVAEFQAPLDDVNCTPNPPTS